MIPLPSMPDRPDRNPGREVHVGEPILGFSTIWFTRHALRRMKDRSISQAEVLRTLREPELKRLKTQRGRQRWRRNRSPRLAIDVVFEKTTDYLCIITVIDIIDP